MPNTDWLLKAESVGDLNTPNLAEKGHTGINSLNHFIDDLRKKELKIPARFCTFDQMMEDESVSTSVNARSYLTTLGLQLGKFKSKGSKASDDAADRLNYNIRNMTYGSWFQAMKDANTDLKYGFSILNVVFERRKYGKYKDSICIKKLAPRSPKSLHSWVWDENFRELKGFVQKPMLKASRNAGWNEYAGNVPVSVLSAYREHNYPFISINEVLLFSYNSTMNNPQGNPPLADCFGAYVEKKICEQLELSGLNKDLAGMYLVSLPSEVFQAANDPTHPKHADAARAVKEYADDVNKMQRSESNTIFTQSDRDANGHKLYDIEILNVKAGSTNYTTTEVIREKKKAIYNVFGTQALLLGQDSVGSNALSKDQNTTFRYYVERDMEEKVDIINTQLATKLLKANGIELDYDDMPEFVPLNPFKLSADEAGKLAQRLQSVNLMEPVLYKSILDDLGYAYDAKAVDDIDYSSKGTSRAGESKGTSGTGDTQMVVGGDNNLENAGVSKSLKASSDSDRIFDKNGNVVNAEDLDEDGHYK